MRKDEKVYCSLNNESRRQMSPKVFVFAAISLIKLCNIHYEQLILLKIPSATSHVQNILILKYEEIQYIFYILNVLFIST